MATKKYYAVWHIGQSNQEPTAPRSSYVALVPEIDYSVLTPDPSISIYYGKACEKINLLTFYHPELVATYPGGSPPSPWTSYERYAKWLPWTHLEYTNNPNVVGFRQPNAYHQQRGPLDTVSPAYEDKVSIAVDVAIRLHTAFGVEKMHSIQSGIGATTLQVREFPIIASQWGWFIPERHTNWSPADPDGCAARAVLELESAKTAAELEDADLEIIAIHMAQGESDAVYNSLAEAWPRNMNRFVDWARQKVYDLGLSSVSASRIPFIWEQLQLQFSATNVPVMNAALTKRQQDDPYFGTTSIDGVTTVDGVHSDAAGIRLRGQRVVDKLLEIRQRPFAAMRVDNVPTLAELRALVRQEIERNTTTSNYTDGVIDFSINSAYAHIIKNSGDLSWWLRKHTNFTLSVTGTDPITLPLVVTRLLEIIPVGYPTLRLRWDKWGHEDNGHLQIVVHDCYDGEVFLRHIEEPPMSLVGAGDRPVLPAEYIETLVANAAWRASQTSGNANLEVKFKARAIEAMERMMGHINKVERQEKAAMRTRARSSIWGTLRR